MHLQRPPPPPAGVMKLDASPNNTMLFKFITMSYGTKKFHVIFFNIPQFHTECENKYSVESK